MSPEFFQAPGIPESKDAQEERQAKQFDQLKNIFKLGLERYTKRTGIPWEKFEAEHQHFLRNVDFEEIKEIFSEYLARSLSRTIEPNVIGPERIVLAYTTNSYQPEVNAISLISQNMLFDEDKIDGTLERWETIDGVYGDRELAQLHALMHEETHAVGRNLCIGMGQGSDGLALYGQSGYKRVSNPENAMLGNQEILEFQGKPIVGSGNRRFNEIFDSFNEGVTERFNRQVLIEYLNRTGHHEKNASTFKKNLLENDDRLSYSSNVKLVERIIKKLSEHTGLPSETVWNALIRGLMEGEMFADKDVEELFTQTFGPDFLKKMSLAEDKEGVNQLLDEMKYISEPPKPQ
jgi:hypothetical protein